MSDIHRQIFKLQMIELDGYPLGPAQRLRLQAHLSTCPACQADLQLYQGLRLQADRRQPAAPAPVAMEKILHGARLRGLLHWATLPLRALLWIGLAVLALVVIQWMFTGARPLPGVLPPGPPTPKRIAPTLTPTGLVDSAGKIPLEPLLLGEPAGSGFWSQDGDYFFVPILENSLPGGDRRTTSLHFIASNTGQDCHASETFLGPQGYQNYAWLDNNTVLFIDSHGRALLFTPCQPGVQDLSDRFHEPLLRLAQSLISQEPAAPGPLLLASATAYWLLDPLTLQPRRLAEPVPSPDSGDSFARALSGRQMLVMQPVAGKPDLSRLVLLDLDSGQVLRSLEIDASNEGRAPFVEWLGPERPFVWSYGSGGPLMLDLSADPPVQVRVLPELFGLNLDYPIQMSSMGVFYSPASGSYHIVLQVNLPGDSSIYLYHGENGQAEKLDGTRPAIMILPGDQRMPLVPLQDTPTYADGYDLLWVDAPDKPQVHLQVSGHTPRNYQTLQTCLLAGSTRLLFGSTQGVSMLGLPGGEELAFWQLAGAESSTLPTFSLDPNGRAVVVTAHLNDSQSQGSLLYWLSLGK